MKPATKQKKLKNLLQAASSISRVKLKSNMILLKTGNPLHGLLHNMQPTTGSNPQNLQL
jgi:hypothetical protein